MAVVVGLPKLSIMTLRPYSTRPGRLALQLLADASVLVWIYVWYRIGRWVHDSLVSVGTIGYSIDTNAGRVAGSLQAGRQLREPLPLVGGQVGAPISDAGRQVAAMRRRATRR